MIEVDTNTLKHFKNKGWCIVKSRLSNQELFKYREKVHEIEINAKKKNYSIGRVYVDYVNAYNLAAVEAPLNNLVSNKHVFDFFYNIQLGTAINKIMGWDNTICTLIRLFCMDSHNYSGHWHQDLDSSNTAVQASVIFNDENGFKIIKKDKKNDFFNKSNMLKLEKHAKKNVLPTLLNENYYDTINVKLGDVLLFDPFLLHKGSSNNKRLQFHMRFLKFDREKDLDFFKPDNFDFYFKSFYDFAKSEDEIIKILPRIIRSSLFYKFKNSINYYIPFVNMLNYLKQVRTDKNFDYEIFSNTAYQKENN